MAEPTNTSTMPEMVGRIVMRLADSEVPMNRFTFRDAIIAMCITCDGPLAVNLAPRAADEWLQEIVRLVIEEMRNGPTTEMLKAGTLAYETPGQGFLIGAWRAMCDAALR